MNPMLNLLVGGSTVQERIGRFDSGEKVVFLPQNGLASFMMLTFSMHVGKPWQ